MQKYAFIDHTADLGLEIYGKDLKELFQNAGEALFEIICDRTQVVESVEKQLRVDGEDLEQLMVIWLGELLYLHDAERLLFRRFEILELEEKTLKAVVYGEAFCEGRHTIRTTVKAVTYHQIRIKQEERRWTSRVIFDV